MGITVTEPVDRRGCFYCANFGDVGTEQCIDKGALAGFDAPHNGHCAGLAHTHGVGSHLSGNGGWKVWLPQQFRCVLQFLDQGGLDIHWRSNRCAIGAHQLRSFVRPRLPICVVRD